MKSLELLLILCLSGMVYTSRAVAEEGQVVDMTCEQEAAELGLAGEEYDNFILDCNAELGTSSEAEGSAEVVLTE